MAKDRCQANAARLLANARPRGIKTAASDNKEWHTNIATFTRDDVKVIIARSRPARAGQAILGTTTTPMGKGKRGGMLVLPGWGLMRANATAWDLIGIASSRSTRPVHKRAPASKDGSQAFAISL